MKKITLTIFTLLLTTTISASIALADFSGYWSGAVEIISIDVGSEGPGNIILKTSPDAPAECSYVYRLYVDHMQVDKEKQKMLYQQVAMSLLSNKPVSIFYSDDGGCFVSNIILYKE